VRWRNGFLLEGWDRNPPTADPSYCGIRARHFMYTEYGDGSTELYNTRTDPWELHNLAAVPADHAELARLHAQMLRDCRPPPPGFHPH
jgi:arylsulfatase A-like enzyme